MALTPGLQHEGVGFCKDECDVHTDEGGLWRGCKRKELGSSEAEALAGAVHDAAAVVCREGEGGGDVDGGEEKDTRAVSESGFEVWCGEEQDANVAYAFDTARKKDKYGGEGERNWRRSC
jgi:hypothetical protein